MSFYEHGYEPLDSIKAGEFCYDLNDYWLLKERLYYGGKSRLVNSFFRTQVRTLLPDGAVWCVLLGSSLTVEGIGGMDMLTYHCALSIGFKCPMLLL